LTFLAGFVLKVKRMRRMLRVQTAFTPTRLSVERLQSAYELVAPSVRRTVRQAAVAASTGVPSTSVRARSSRCGKREAG
jgi:hypothetical protein